MEITKIFGAPGCGKTTRLMSILKDELAKVAPNEIAYVSFTRKGTYEGVRRACELFNYTEKDLPYFRTLHSIAFREGGYSKYDMISKTDFKTFSDAMAMSFVGYYTEEFYNNDDKYLFLHFLKRNNINAADLYLNDFAFDIDRKKLEMVEDNYQRFKLHEKVVDFTDIIEAFILRNKPLPIKVAIIDEIQDLTSLQWKMCEVAFRNAERVYMAGDDDQAIYEWSGADVNMFLSYKANNNEILKQSYRLKANILKLAKGISAQIKNRVAKDFNPMADEGKVFFYNDLSELEINANETYYFLSRNNFFLSTYRKFLRDRAQVYMDKDEPSINKRDIEAINTFERARKRGHFDDKDDVKLKLFLDKAPNIKLPWFNNLNFDNDTTLYYRDLIRTKANLENKNLQINTIHGVKGGEADNVVLMLDFTKSVKANIQRNLDAELRCLYVGITRARNNLHIVHTTSKCGYDDYIDFGGLK